MEPVEQIPDNLFTLNETELAYIIRRQTGLVIKRSVRKERLVQLVEEGGAVLEEEIAESTRTRKELQLYVEQNWEGVNSQLPCKGPDKGKCTIYPCPEGRHVDCFLSAGPHIKLHGI